jgi:hypothetical protein
LSASCSSKSCHVMMRVPHPSLFLKLNRIESCALCGGRRPGRGAAAVAARHAL